MFQDTFGGDEYPGANDVSCGKKEKAFPSYFFMCTAAKSVSVFLVSAVRQDNPVHHSDLTISQKNIGIFYTCRLFYLEREKPLCFFGQV